METYTEAKLQGLDYAVSEPIVTAVGEECCRWNNKTYNIQFMNEFLKANIAKLSVCMIFDQMQHLQYRPSLDSASVPVIF